MDAFRTAALVAVTNAWWAGRVTPDDVVSVAGAAEVVGAAGSAPVLLTLARLRDAGTPALLLALPRPGDPAEVQADADVLAAACAAGSIAVCTGPAGSGLLPTQAGWRLVAAGLRSWPEPQAARRDLQSAVVAAGDSIISADVGWDLPTAAHGIEARLSGVSTFAKYLDPRAAELAHRAARVLAMLDLAASTEPTAITAGRAATSSTILGPHSELAAAALAALAAAVNDSARALVKR